ncbi:hypothetical protein AVHY2522_11015 [Acidovorax sp. SUPP2522]|uniref:hypothetical protein n=1 Tax=unclassified Acidovorax TaxID=2684926 RepID=UPI00234B0E1D|nr:MULTISPECIES: hypothetical protein [unclassified Acidovorax]WCM99407.1 hypothetical protein M5C96_08335 [Acidovorax sp. GBBC 1281]GKT16254.1 hypothetical protein AVHY2522_11015 [Acidovorax sp. SUPP2522]
MRAPSSLSVRSSLLRGALAAAALLPPWPALAQAPGPVADPLAPAGALVHRSVFTTAAPPVETGTEAWRDAQAAVAATPRGHADIVAWEARQAAPSAASATPTAGHGAHHHPPSARLPARGTS